MSIYDISNQTSNLPLRCGDWNDTITVFSNLFHIGGSRACKTTKTSLKAWLNPTGASVSQPSAKTLWSESMLGLIATFTIAASIISAHASTSRLSASSFSRTGTCSGKTNVVLVDGRQIGANNQCRVRCTTFNKPEISVTEKSVDCNILNSDIVSPFKIPFGDTFSVCIPRGVCIKQCGQEAPGCVYTGTCTSQTCFKSSVTSGPAELTRVTYYGPGSIITVGNLSTSGLRSQSLSNPESWHVAICKFNNTSNSFFVATESCSSVTPIGDGRVGNKGQCRAACLKYAEEDIEVVVNWGTCGVCNPEVAGQYINTVNQTVCIPRSTCKLHCGTLVDGCLHSGICFAKICFSGIDSKKPAEIIWLSEDRIQVSVNNMGRAISYDPPAFAGLPISIDSDPSSNGPSLAPTPSVSPVAGQNSSASKTPQETSKASPWPWLGPLIGTLVTGICGIVIAIVKKRRAIAVRVLVETEKALAPMESGK